MSWNWYSVKTLYRTKAYGEPIATDEYYDQSVTMVEERIVLFKARSFDEAIKRGEKETTEYTELSHVNPYGQRVKTHLIDGIDAFKLFEDLPKGTKSGTEIYSITTIVSDIVDDDKIIDWNFGSKMYPESARANIVNRLFSGVCGDVEQHKKIDDYPELKSKQSE